MDQRTRVEVTDGGDAKAENPVWWKPDPQTGSFELARITTRTGHATTSGADGPRTDFFELYWADLTNANTVAQFKDWFMSLLWRKPSQVPRETITSTSWV